MAEDEATTVLAPERTAEGTAEDDGAAPSGPPHAAAPTRNSAAPRWNRRENPKFTMVHWGISLQRRLGKSKSRWRTGVPSWTNHLEDT